MHRTDAISATLMPDALAASDCIRFCALTCLHPCALVFRIHTYEVVPAGPVRRGAPTQVLVPTLPPHRPCPWCKFAFCLLVKWHAIVLSYFDSDCTHSSHASHMYRLLQGLETDAGLELSQVWICADENHSLPNVIPVVPSRWL